MYSKKNQIIEEKLAYVLAFGQNKDGELGLGNQQDAFLPEPINGFEPARSVSSGSHHSMMVSKSGKVFTCGSALHGKLGLQINEAGNLVKFTQVQLPTTAKSVAVGDYHTLCLTDSGQVYAWGGSLHKKTANAAGGSKPLLVKSLLNVVVT